MTEKGKNQEEPVAQLTLQVSDTEVEEISLYPGDNISEIINEFSQFYSLEKNISDMIKDELKRQLDMNDSVEIDGRGEISWSSEQEKSENGDFFKKKIFKKKKKKQSRREESFSFGGDVGYADINLKKKKLKEKKKGKNKNNRLERKKETKKQKNSSNPYEKLLKNNSKKNSEKNNFSKSKQEEEEINPYEKLIRMVSRNPQKSQISESKKSQNSEETDLKEETETNIESVEMMNFLTKMPSDNEENTAEDLEAFLLQSKNIEDESVTDASLAEIYECLQEKFKGKGNFQKSSSSSYHSRLGRISSKVYQKVDREKIKEKVKKKHNLKKSTENEKYEKFEKLNKTKDHKVKAFRTVERLLKYGKEKQERMKEISLKREEELRNIEEKEVLTKPKIGKNSIKISKKNSRNKCYKTIHDKLFYNGIEGIKISEEKREIEFSKLCPFYPNVEKFTNSGTIDDTKGGNENLKFFENQRFETVTKKTANEIYLRFMQDKQLNDDKIEIIRKFESNYDKETGQKLFKPKINKKKKFTKSQKIIKKKPKLEIKDLKSFITKCRQIFEFLDIDNEELIFANKTNLSNFHPKTVKLLTPLILQIFIEENNGNSPSMDFPLFYKMIREGELESEVNRIFDVLMGEKWRRPGKRPPFRV